MAWGPKTPKPDPQIAKNNAELVGIADRQQDLAERVYNDERRLTEEYAPLFKSMIKQSVADAEPSRARGAAQWASYTNDFAPLERKMATTAANFDTAGRREQEAAGAVGDVATRFGVARDERNRAGLVAGLSADKLAVLDSAARIEQAKAEAGAGNLARRNVEMQGISLVDNATRFGRNMPSTGLATAALAGQQTGQAQGQVGGLTALTAQPAQMTSGMLGQAAGTIGQSTAGYIGQYQGALQAAQMKNALIGDIIGAAGKTAGLIWGKPPV